MKYKLAKFLGRKVLYITAHPDDESYLCSGTMVKNCNMGGTNFLICATDGEQGIAHLQKPVTMRQLKEIRKKELVQVSKLLKVNKLHTLEIPDGKVASHIPKFYKQSLAFAKSVEPEFILGFGRDGITGHHDHVAAFKVAKAVAKKLNKPYYAFALPPRMAKNALNWFVPRRRAKHYHDGFTLPRANVKVPIDKKVKLRALSCHCSQLDGDNAYKGFPKYAVAETLAADYFIEH